MKYLKFLLIIGLITSAVSCKKDSRYPEVENSANAQFKRTLGVVLTTTPSLTHSFNSFTLSKATPAAPDEFTLDMTGGENVASVNIVVDYRKVTANVANTIYTQPYATITSWPKTYTTNLNSLVALFAPNGLTVAGLAATDQFVFRVIFTLKSGTVVSGQATVLNVAPYLITLTYRVTA